MAPETESVEFSAPAARGLTAGERRLRCQANPRHRAASSGHLAGSQSGETRLSLSVRSNSRDVDCCRYGSSALVSETCRLIRSPRLRGRGAWAGS